MKYVSLLLSAMMTLALHSGVRADEFGTNVPMRVGNATTFYVQAQVGDLDEVGFMVDTGSGFMTINEETLAALQTLGQAEFDRELRGVLANGSEMVVPVYRLSHVNIGGGCHLTDVEAAVFPGKTRQILGLNALKQAGPFIFSFDPPQLVLSNCTQPDLLAQAATDQPVSRP